MAAPCMEDGSKDFEPSMDSQEVLLKITHRSRQLLGYEIFNMIGGNLLSKEHMGNSESIRNLR